MALYDILHFPDPRLHIKAQPVEKIDDSIKKLVEDMYETMYHAKGVGLAATQIGVNWRIFTMDASETRDQPMCVINPEILSQEGVWNESEGCLSVPEIYDKVPRAARVHMRGIDLDGNPIELRAENLMAHIIQHEVDHLNGILFINHLSRLKFERVKKKVEKEKRRTENPS